MWFNELYKRRMGQTSRQIRGRMSRQWTNFRPRMEDLEDRTLLTAPTAFTVPELSVSGANQFGGGNSSLTGSQFLGGTFDVSKVTQIGNLDPDRSGFFGGYQLSLSMSGKVGLDASYNVNGGEVDATYNNITLNQNFREPVPGNQKVLFTPQNTNVSYGAGSFSTTSPSVGAGLALDTDIKGSIGGKIVVLGSLYSGSSDFGGSLNQPFISYDSVNGLEIFGLPLSLGETSTGDAGVSFGQGFALPSLTFPVEIAPGVSISVTVGPNSNATGLEESLDLNEGIVGVTKLTTVDGSINLGSASQSAPSITLNSSTLQSGNALSDTQDSPFATTAVQMGPLVASLLGLPLAGALLSTATITAGPLSASVTPVSFTLGPNLTFSQTGTVTPTNQLTYDFYTDSTQTTPMSVGVTENGQYLGKVSSVTFDPGVDNISLDFTGAPITVQPTWTYGLDYTNMVDLNASLQGTLTVGQASAELAAAIIPGFTSDVQLGPIYTHDFDFADATLAHIYNDTFSIGTHSQKLASFIIGDTFQPSLAVTTTADGNTNGSGTLRFAVGSADFLGANKSTPEIITLGPGTYNLQSAFGGTLDVTAGNVIIQGAGAGQTIINATGFNAGIFQVRLGASLTLNGVTLENGGSMLTSKHVNGGGVYVSGGGSLTVNGSVFAGNQGIFGGAIYNSGGSVTVNDSGFTVNEAWMDGGGVYNNGGTLTVNNGYFYLNDAWNDGGGAVYTLGPGTTSVTNSLVQDNYGGYYGGGFYNSSGATLTISNSTLYFNHAGLSDGGGVYNSDSTLTIINSTLYQNRAAHDGGGLYLVDSLRKPTLINDTFTQNFANSEGGTGGTGGAIYIDSTGSATPYLRNTIVAGNGNTYVGVGTNGLLFATPDDIKGTVDAASSNNLIGTAGSGGLTNGSNGNKVNVSNPGLGGFGGPNSTVSLLPGSPAIDAGSNALAVDASDNTLTTDQRGYSRIDNSTVDIGSVEFQTELALSGGFVPGIAPGTLVYSYQVLNNGPDSVAGATVSVPLPQGTVFQSATVPTGWTETDPGAGNNGTVVFTETGSLTPGQSTNFTITVQLQNTTVGATLSNTATVAFPWDTNLQNNSVTLAATNEQEGLAVHKALLYHFAVANLNARASDFTASVDWGGGVNNTSRDGSGTISVVANPGGGFDVLGSHTYVEEGEYEASVFVTGLDGTKYDSAGIANVLQNENLATVTSFNPPNGKEFGPVTATVNWGDGSTNTDTDGSGTVSVVSQDNKVFDVIGYHVYSPIAGSYTITVIVGQTIFGIPSTLYTTVAGIDGNPKTVTFSSSDGTNVPQQMFVVADAPLTAGALTPIPNAAINQPVSSPVFPANTVLYNFFKVSSAFFNSHASDYTATVNWGDGTSNTNRDNTGTVTIIGDLNHGGFDVVGVSHTYTQPGSYEISVSVVGPENFSSPNAFNFVQGDGVRLFHFTDADPNGTASDYTATVRWGDGQTSTITSTPSNAGQIVAGPAGGFDVYGSHTYTSVVGWPTPATFSVTVNDEGGSSTGEIATAIQVLYADQPLTAGTLNVPSVTTEGQSITNNVLFHFSDADSGAQTSEFLATVSWGDGIFETSRDNPNRVRVVANTTIGGFDVVGSHVYVAGSFTFAVIVKDLGDLSSAHPDNGGQVITAASAAFLNIAEVPVIPAAGPTFTASPNSLSTVQTVATFTDPGVPESDANSYLAIIQWGDGTVTATSLKAQANYGQASVSGQQITGKVVSASNVGGIVLASDGQTFLVNLAHQYTAKGAYTITTTILHGGTTAGPVTTQAVVADQVAATGGFSIEGIAGISTGNQTVATFTDPEGAGPLPDYSASINWGDGTSSQPDISSGAISFNATTQVFTVSASHTYAHVGASYPITVVIDNLHAFPTTVASAATITPATPTVPTPIIPSHAVYNGQPQGATVGDVTGINNTDLGAPTLTYYVGSYTLATLPSSGGSSTAPADSGFYTVVAAYAGSTDYLAVSSVATYSIGQATPSVPTPSVPGHAVYNGHPQGATVGDVTGVNNTDLGAPALTYYVGSYTLATLPSSGGGSLVPTNAGNYTVVASYAGSTDYKAVSGLATYSISPAQISYTIGNDTQTYGSPANLALDLPASFNTGINGETLSISYASTGATATAHVGSYPINGAASNGTGALSNYAVTLNRGTLAVKPYAFSYQIGSDAQVAGIPANLAADLGTTLATGVNGQTLAITYASTGNTASSAPGAYPITATLANGSGLTSDYSVTLLSGVLTVSGAVSEILVLDPSAPGALKMSGNSVINESSWPVYVNSSSSNAIQLSGNASLTASKIFDVGGYQKSGNAVFHPTPVTGSAVAGDPLVNMLAPSAGSSQGAVNLSGNSSQTIQPGTYTRIAASDNANLTLAPGVYIVTSGGLSASGNATIKGSGVVIYIAAGSVTLSGYSTVLLTAPTSGAYNGVGIFQARSDKSTLNLSENAYLSSGTVYAPYAAFNLSGNSNLSAPLIVGQLALSGNADPSPTPPSRLNVSQTSESLDLLAFIRGLAQGSVPGNFANASTGTGESLPNSVQGGLDQIMAGLSTGASSNFGEELPALLTQAHDGNLIFAAIEDVLGGLDVSDLSN